MSSIPGYSMEAWLEWNYSVGQADPKFKLLVYMFEEYRTYIEDKLSDFDEDNQSWRAYNSAVFGDCFPEEFEKRVDALLPGSYYSPTFTGTPTAPVVSNTQQAVGVSTIQTGNDMSYSKDTATGLAVQERLMLMGVETPFIPTKIDKPKLQSLFADIMTTVGLDLSDDSLAETPRRLAKLYSNEFFAGLDYDNFPTATVVANKMGFDEIILERNVQVRSLCEHHFLPIVGGAFVAYLPEEKVLGLSKINRIVDFFCRRPQIQERLTLQIYHALSYLLETDNVAVIIEAEHMCVKLRGVEDACSDTITSKLGGKFKDGPMRAEFIALAKGMAPQ